MTNRIRFISVLALMLVITAACSSGQAALPAKPVTSQDSPAAVQEIAPAQPATSAPAPGPSSTPGIAQAVVVTESASERETMPASAKAEESAPEVAVQPAWNGGAIQE